MFWEPALATDGARAMRGPLIADSAAAAGLFGRERWPPGVEQLLVAHLDAAQHLIALTRYRSAVADELTVPVRAIVADCARHDSEALVIAHNHPSGVLRPTRADLETTRRLGDVLRALDIPLHDHLIFAADGRSVSLREMGLL